jgi:glutamine synthetase
VLHNTSGPDWIRTGQEAASVVAPYEAVSSVEEIEAAKAKGIRFVQLQFTDIIGVVKAVTIPVHQLEGSVRHGTWFDGSSVEGFTRIAESDQYLMPDMRTFSEIPCSGARSSGRRSWATS